MKVGLFIPCYINAVYPGVGVRRTNCSGGWAARWIIPSDRPAAGSRWPMPGSRRTPGRWQNTWMRFLRSTTTWSGPSASCVVFVREGYPRLLDNYREHACVDSRIWEICEFIHDVVKPAKLDARFPHRVSVHNSCHGVRKMGLSSPSELNVPYMSKLRDLLSLVGDIDIAEPSRRDECCGFGGMFSVEENAVSVCMGRDKVRDHMATGAEYITGADSSCLMHMQGVIDHDKLPIRTIHAVEILNSKL